MTLADAHRTLADAPIDPNWQVPVVVKRMAEQIDRGSRLFMAPETIAVVIASSPEVRDALHATSVVEQLKARHAKRTWGDGAPGPQAVVEVCASCNTAWPCADAEILGVA